MVGQLFSAVLEALSDGLVDELMGRREDFEVESEGSYCEGDEDEGCDDAEERHLFAESDDEPDVEKCQLNISRWYFLEHNYYLSHIHLDEKYHKKQPRPASFLKNRMFVA